MACTICKLVGQFFLNGLNMADHVLNFLLLGDPNETISARTARARATGSKAASVFCSILTFLAHVLTSSQVDHCTYALDPSIEPNCREIWDWNNNTILTNPDTIINDVEIPDADPQ